MNRIVILSLTTLIALNLTNSAFAKKFKNKKEMCTYFEEKKDQAEDRMHEGYTVKQYNKLETKRKYWKKKYIENCF